MKTDTHFFSLLNRGLTPDLLQIEVSSQFQIPHFVITGLPGQEVSEAKERIKAAFNSTQIEFPKRKVVVNLSPADLKKQGTDLDLPIALAIAAHCRELNQSSGSPFGSVAAAGELKLDGSILQSKQVTRTLYAAVLNGVEAVILPLATKERAIMMMVKILKGTELAKDKKIPRLFFADTFEQAVSHLFSPNLSDDSIEKATSSGVSTILSKARAPVNQPSRRILRAAMASLIGFHHILFVGKRGSGKTNAVDWMQSQFQPLFAKSEIEQELLIELNPSLIVTNSPLTTPTQVRPSALMGSIRNDTLIPGLLSLAHGQLLQADEFLEWHRDSRECLRTPMEKGEVEIIQSKNHFRVPARFQLAATANLCPCGNFGDSPAHSTQDSTMRSLIHSIPCNCPTSSRNQYFNRLSGPLLDRFDLVVLTKAEAPPCQADKDRADKNLNEAFDFSPTPNLMKLRQEIIDRFQAPSAHLPGEFVENWISSHRKTSELLSHLPFSSLRSRHHTVRVSISLATLDRQEMPSEAHFHEAMAYQSDRLRHLTQ